MPRVSLPRSVIFFEQRGVRDMAFDLSMPILVVDDYNTMIRIIRNLLKQIGFENVDDASDGSAALAKMQGKKYGLVISDWNMEPMTGYDLLREVRASPELSQTPFIMITGGVKDRKRHRREEGRGQQLHRQAVQRRHLEDQDGSGVSGGGRLAFASDPNDLFRAVSKLSGTHPPCPTLPGRGAAATASAENELKSPGDFF